MEFHSCDNSKSHNIFPNFSFFFFLFTKLHFFIFFHKTSHIIINKVTSTITRLYCYCYYYNYYYYGFYPLNIRNNLKNPDVLFLLRANKHKTTSTVSVSTITAGFHKPCKQISEFSTFRLHNCSGKNLAAENSICLFSAAVTKAAQICLGALLLSRYYLGYCYYEFVTCIVL